MRPRKVNAPLALVITSALVMAAPLTSVRPASAAPRIRTRVEKAFGACVTVPTGLFPRRGVAATRERTVDDTNGDTKQRTETVFSTHGSKDREISIWIAESYAEPTIGWKIPVDTQYITRTVDGYRAKGVWDPETEPPGGGPWYGRGYRLADGRALMAEVYLATGDDKRADVAAMVSSIRRC